MAETTNISKLIINYLTEEQYTTAQASGLINANELYIESAQRLLGGAHPSTHSADIIVDGTTNKAYTASEQTKLAGIASGAEVNVNADWNASSGDAQILNKPSTMTPSSHTHAATAVSITDSGGYFTSENTEGALQELGSAVDGIETLLAAI